MADNDTHAEVMIDLRHALRARYAAEPGGPAPPSPARTTGFKACGVAPA
jgi:hypothetical protein